VDDNDKPTLDYAPPSTPDDYVDRFDHVPPTPGWPYLLYAALIMFAIAAGLAIGLA
jgi:hypothetical protein